MQLLPVRLSTLLKLSVLYYAVYLTFFACRADYSHSNELVQYTCGHLNRSVYPIWTSQVQPRLDSWDKQYQVTAQIKPVVAQVRAQIAKFDEEYEISYKLERVWAQIRIWASQVFGDAHLKIGLFASYQIARGKLYYEGSMAPISQYYVAQYQKSWGNYVDSLATKARVNTELFYKSSKRHSQRLLTLHVAPFYHKSVKTVSTHPYVVTLFEKVRPHRAVGEIKRVFSILAEKSVVYSSKLQEKTDFIRSEINNFNKIDEFKKKWKGDTASIVDVVNDILEDVTSSIPSDLDSDSGSEEVVITLTSTKTRTSTLTLSRSGPPDQDSEAETATAKATTEASVDDLNAGVASVDLTEEDVSKYGDDSSQAQIDFELNYWKSKVDKTLDLAYNNLENDMKSFLNTSIAVLKENISNNFTKLQLDNYKRYKVMNELISAIDKDSEEIRESGKIIEEPEVDRQIMRDKIKEAYDVVESTMKDVEANLNAAHLEVMEKYFEVVQSTVDVLESFADTTILDFSNRLTGLLDILETNTDFEDELSWSAWKQFHKVRDLIFNIRDLIFDEAEKYKVNPRGTIKPNGLNAWDEYLDNINFHIKFLLTDNDEYLKLVRAKANVAYQLREGLTRELIAKAEREAEAAAEAEAGAAAEAEAAEAADAEKDTSELDVEAAPQVILEQISNEDLENAEAAPEAEEVNEKSAKAAEPIKEIHEQAASEKIESEEPIDSEEPVEESELIEEPEPIVVIQSPEPIEVPVLEEIKDLDDDEAVVSPHVSEKQPKQFEEDGIVEDLEADPEVLEATD